MQKSLKLIALSFLVLGMSGCEHFKGSLAVHSDFTLNNHHIAKRVAHFTPGTYFTKIKLHRIENLIEIHAEGHAPIKLPIPHALAYHNGSINLRGESLGQTWNAQGTFTTDIYDTPTREGTISCVLYYREFWVGGRYPRYVSEPVYGIQNVLKHDRVNTRKLDLHFVSLDGRTTLADLTADDPSVVTLIDKVTSGCY